MIHPAFEKAIWYFGLIIFIISPPIIFWEKSGYEYVNIVEYVFWMVVFFPVIFIFDFLSQLFGRLYGFKVRSIVAEVFLKNTNRIFKVPFFVEIFVPFYLTICLFAIIYLHLGYTYPDSFKESSEISFVKAFYFSLTTLTVGPAGLEPKSALAHLVVMLEVLLGLTYAILIFSAISSYILQKRT